MFDLVNMFRVRPEDVRLVFCGHCKYLRRKSVKRLWRNWLGQGAYVHGLSVLTAATSQLYGGRTIKWHIQLMILWKGPPASYCVI